jgi:hypothetical protein
MYCVYLDELKIKLKLKTFWQHICYTGVVVWR